MGGEAGEVGDRQAFGPRRRVHPRRPERVLRRSRRARPSRQRGPQHLPTLRERRVHDGEDRGPVAGRRVVPGEREQARVDVRYRPEHRPRHRPRPARRCVPRQLRARHPVRPAPGPRGEPLRDLGLHHDQAPAHRRQLGEQVQHHRHADVVRQVRDQRGRLDRQVRGPHAQRVRGHDVQPVGQRGRPVGHGRGQPPGQQRVDLHGAHRAGGLEQSEGQRAESGADLEHDVVGGQVGGADDPAHGVGVVHEVLPEPLGRPQAQLVGERPHLGGPQQPSAVPGCRPRGVQSARDGRVGGRGAVGGRAGRGPTGTGTRSPRRIPGRGIPGRCIAHPPIVPSAVSGCRTGCR